MCRGSSIKPAKLARRFIDYVENDAQSGGLSAAVWAKYAVNITLFYTEG